MDKFDFTNLSDDRSDNHSNVSSGNLQYQTFVNGTTFTVILISLPVTLVAIFALYSLIRKDHIAPIYVINLLVSDIIQLCFMMAEAMQWWYGQTTANFYYIYYYGLMASVGFMVCVALERYLALALPLWYHFRRSTKNPLVVCVIVWTLPIAFLLPIYFIHQFQFTQTVLSAFLLIPCPIFIFLLGATLKSLSKTSIPTDEKRQIVSILVLVLLIYILLFMPTIIWSLVQKTRESSSLSKLSYTLMQFSPLADSFLYVFLKKGALDLNLC